MKKIILVLGMHRSATSMTTEILSSYGLYVGNSEDLWEPAQDNQRGYFENKYAVQLNDKILYEHGMHWATVEKKFINDVRTNYTNEIDDILKNMLKKAQEKQVLLLKDPRMCLVEPVWKKQIRLLGLEEHIVMVFRHPYEVAMSLQIRDKIHFVYAMKIWFYNNYCALCSVAVCDTPVLVLNHDEYFVAFEKQKKKIENFLKWTGVNNRLDEIIDVTLRHNKVSKIHEKIDVGLNEMVLELYQYLLELSNMEKVIISKEKLKIFSEYWKKIEKKGYLLDGKDKEPIVFRDCLRKEKKAWCIYQLQCNSETLIYKFSQYRESGDITKCSIYGNGTVTKALLPILMRARIDVETIYDQKPVQNSFAMIQYQIRVADIKTAVIIEGTLLNTVVNHETQVSDELSDKFVMCKVLNLYELLWFFLQ